MRDNYENSDISIISKEPTWKTWIISKGPTWSYWVRPRRPVRQLQKLAGGSDLIRPEQVVFFYIRPCCFLYLSLLFFIFASVVFLYLPLLFFIIASVVFYICLCCFLYLPLLFFIFSALSSSLLSSIIVHITSVVVATHFILDTFWCQEPNKLANGDFVTQTFCSRNKRSRACQLVFHHHLLFWKESKAPKLSILTTF